MVALPAKLILKVWPPTRPNAGSVEAGAWVWQVDAGIRNYVLMRGAGDVLAISEAIGAHQHVGLRAFMRSKMRAAGGVGGVRCGVLPGLVAVHAKRADAGSGDFGSILKRDRRQGADQVGIGAGVVSPCGS